MPTFTSRCRRSVLLWPVVALAVAGCGAVNVLRSSASSPSLIDIDGTISGIGALTSFCSVSQIGAPPFPEAKALVSYGPTSAAAVPNGFRVLCDPHPVAKNDSAKFGIVLGPPNYGRNSVRYPIEQPLAGFRQWRFIAKGAITGPSDCIGKVSYSVFALDANGAARPVYTAGPTDAATSEGQIAIRGLIPEGSIQLEIVSHSDGAGQVGSNWCDHAIVGEPWLQPVR